MAKKAKAGGRFAVAPMRQVGVPEQEIASPAHARATRLSLGVGLHCLTDKAGPPFLSGSSGRQQRLLGVDFLDQRAVGG